MSGHAKMPPASHQVSATSLKLLIQQVHPHVRVERDSGMCVARDLYELWGRSPYTRVFVARTSHCVPGLGVFWGTSTQWSRVSIYFGCLSNFKEVFKYTGFFKSTESAPMADFYNHFLENPDWRMAACINMGYRRLTDHYKLQGEAYSGIQMTTMIYALRDLSGSSLSV